MATPPPDDRPGFLGKQPEHCLACCRLITAGQTYYQTIEEEVLCADCALSEGLIRVRDDLAVEVKRDRLVVKRGHAEVEVFPHEVRHLVSALAEAAGRLVDPIAQGDSIRVNLQWRGSGRPALGDVGKEVISIGEPERLNRGQAVNRLPHRGQVPCPESQHSAHQDQSMKAKGQDGRRGACDEIQGWTT